MAYLNQVAECLAKEDSQNFEQQKASILELMNFPNSEAVDILALLLKNYENPILIKIALTVLSEMQNSEALAVLSNCMFEHPNRLHRGDAARALGYSRGQRALAPLKRLLQSPVEQAADLPISEGLWAVMSLCQAGIIEADEEWLSLVNRWKDKEIDYRILASAITNCLDSLKAPS